MWYNLIPLTHNCTTVQVHSMSQLFAVVCYLIQCFIFKAYDHSCSVLLAHTTHLGSDLLLMLIMIIAPVTRPHGLWRQPVEKMKDNSGRICEAPLYDLSLTMKIVHSVYTVYMYTLVNKFTVVFISAVITFPFSPPNL